MDPQGGSNRSLRSRKSSIGRFAEEAVDGVLHVLLRLPRHPVRVMLLLLPARDVLSTDESKRGIMMMVLMIMMMFLPVGDPLKPMIYDESETDQILNAKYFV